MDNILGLCIVAYLMGNLIGRLELGEGKESEVSAKNDKEMIRKWNERRRSFGMEEHKILDESRRG